MTIISKQDIETLVKLQQAETEIVRLQKILKEVEKEKLKLSLKLKQFEDALEKNRQDFETASAACRDMENEIQVVDARIIKSNENLRMVKTNKEYQILLREVDDNKKRKDGLETQLLEHLDEKEKAEQLVDETEKDYLQLKEQIEAEQEKIEQQFVDDKQALADYQQQQEDIGLNLDAFLMNRFSKISKMNGGLAVVQVKNEVCLGCFMNIPPQLFIEVQRANLLITCPQCSRILYHISE
jgi:predicted  nucleic acid-binding Zn-ribbon protein